MTPSLVAELAAKSFLTAAAVLGLLLALKHRSAAERSWAAHAGLIALLILPTVAVLLPRWRLLAPVTLQSSLADSHGAAFDPGAVLLALYVGIAGLLLLGTAVSILRLHVLHRRADVVVDAGWLTALARAQQRMGVRYGASLLVSGAVSSPLSWGVLRPTILLDKDILSRPGSAEAVITHELAHVTHLDWLKLLVARIVTAVFWFNPLVWMLARQCHQLREEAADDAVLRAEVPGPDYASLLVDAARHENRAQLFAAHGVAPGKDSLRRRVTRVLDTTSSRQTVSLPWAIGGLACVALTAMPLAAATLERAAVAEVSPPRVPDVHDTGAKSLPPAPAQAPASTPATTFMATPSSERGTTSGRSRTLRAAPAPARALAADAKATTFRAAPARPTGQVQSLSLDADGPSIASDGQTRTLRADAPGNEIRITGTMSGQDR